MQHERIQLIRSCYDVDIINYNRNGSALLIGSGCGITLGIMDSILKIGYSLDIDSYRDREHLIDWETIGVIIDHAGFSFIAMAGWFTLDTPVIFEKLQKAIKKTPLYNYEGGGQLSLKEFLSNIEQSENGESTSSNSFKISA